MILTIVPTVAGAQYMEIILFYVNVHSHLHFEIQALEGHIGHIDTFNVSLKDHALAGYPQLLRLILLTYSSPIPNAIIDLSKVLDIVKVDLRGL